MAEPGTLVSELQRGWERFWLLSWRWKAPIIGFAAFMLVGIVAAVAGGGEEDDPEPAVQATQAASPTESDKTETPTPNQGPYSVLEITDVTSDGGEVTISGRTDLPDRADISVTFNIWGQIAG